MQLATVMYFCQSSGSADILPAGKSMQEVQSTLESLIAALMLGGPRGAASARGKPLTEFLTAVPPPASSS